MPRKVIVVLGVIAAIALGVLVVRWIVLRDTSTPVSVQEAVQRAGGSGAAGLVNGVRTPAPGVYVYDTTGSERLEALLSTTHPYPPTTPITVSRGGCGVLMRWTPFEQRETEWELCPGRRAWRLNSIHETHEFFHQRDERRYLCAGGIAFGPQGAWSYVCRFDDTHDAYRARFVGEQTLRVGGRPVRTIHVRDRDVLSGHEQGTGASETWFRASDGLIVRRITSTRDRSPAPGGTATYIERYEFRLRSLEPADSG